MNSNFNKGINTDTANGIMLKLIDKLHDLDEKKIWNILLDNSKNCSSLTSIYNTLDNIIYDKDINITRENANMNSETPSGMMMKFASELSRIYTDECLIKNESVKKAMKQNYIHIHDKDYYPTRSLTCIHYPLDKLLFSNFSVQYSDNRPAKRIESAAMLTSIIFETSQNEMHGGQSVPAFDFYLAPFVRMTYIEEIKNIEKFTGNDYSSLYNDVIDDYLSKDVGVYDLEKLRDNNIVKQHAINATVKRVHQALEAFIHNMNTIHSRGGNQVVFSSINYGTDTSAEGRCIMRELLNATYEGVGRGATAIFPIQIWKKKRGVNFLPEDPNYDLYLMACKVTAKRFYPNFINLDATFNHHDKWDPNDPERYKYEVATMGCRTRVFENRYGEKTSIGRGNVSFTTVNIVRCAIECMIINDRDKRIEAFYHKLDNIMDIAAIQLCERYDFQKTAQTRQFPLLMHYLWTGSDKLKPEDTIESVIKHGTLGIGFIGLAECLIALVGRHHGEDDGAQQLGLEIITHMRKRVLMYSDKYDHNFALLATPAESLCGKFARKDKDDFGVISGVTDKDYYTNSNHIPVYYHCSPRHKAIIEGPYHALATGGDIFYVEVDGNLTKNVQSVMDIVNLIDQYNIGYGAINHNRNHCMNCSYEDSTKELSTCPRCGSSQIDTIQRITGYLVGSTIRWNSAKIAELHDRVIHDN